MIKATNLILFILLTFVNTWAAKSDDRQQINISSENNPNSLDIFSRTIPSNIKDISTRYNDFKTCRKLLKRVANLGANNRTLKDRIEIDYPDIIKGFEKFLKDRPDSYLAGDVKLVLAEYYYFIGVPRPETINSSYEIKYFKGWYEKSLPLLLDVIDNHYDRKDINLVSGEETEDYLAAIALDKLGHWTGNEDFFMITMVMYPDGECAQHARKHHINEEEFKDFKERKAGTKLSDFF